MPQKAEKRQYARTKAFAKVRQGLVEELVAQGLDSPLLMDKIDEYMSFWVRRQQLRDDVESRGLFVEDERGRVSENRSVSLEIQASRQMLAILQTIGIQPRKPSPGYDFDDEL